MTSIREVIQRLLSRLGVEKGRAGFSPTVYWKNLVSDWPVERRHRTRLAVERIVEQSDFEPFEYQRLYHLPEIDEVAHAGFSLLALLRVLEAYDEGEITEEDE